MAINPSDTATVTLAFSEAQLASISLYGFKPEQTHRQHARDEIDSVYVYDNGDNEMTLFVFHKNGDIHSEVREYRYDSGWKSDAEESEDDE
jgi:hypothetical protein